jgi:hypothetical protein
LHFLDFICIHFEQFLIILQSASYSLHQLLISFFPKLV